MTRKVLFFTAIGLLVVAFIASRYISSQAPSAPKVVPPPAVKLVTVDTVLNRTIKPVLSVYGRVVSLSQIDVVTEVGGTLLSGSRQFREGTAFSKGEQFFRVNDQDVRYQLFTLRSDFLALLLQTLPDIKIDYPKSFVKWNDYLADFKIEDETPELPEIQDQKERYFISSRNIFKLYYQIKNLEYQLTKYTLAVPFSGTVMRQMAEPGSYVRPGQILGQFATTNAFELEMGVLQSDLRFVQPGSAVVVINEDDSTQRWVGQVGRISQQVNPTTQTITAYVRISGAGLREGMFLRADIQGPKPLVAYELPRDLLMDQQFVFVVQQDSILRRVPVQILMKNKYTALVQGLTDGTLVLNVPVPGAGDGTKVRVAPEPKPAVNQAATSSKP